MDDSTRQRLIELLAPIHDRARETARRLEARSGDGDDLFQEALLKACEKLSTLRDPEKFPMWFHRILLNTHRNRSRRAFWKRFVRLETDEHSAPVAPGHEGGLAEERFHRARRLARALATLPVEQREAIVLADVQRYALEEIAAMQQVTISAVKSRVTRGRERLRLHYARTLANAPASTSTWRKLVREEGGAA